jgi:hypothetical protein
MRKRRWSDAEMTALISQIVKEKKKLPEIYLPGRTPAAINNYRRFLRENGRLGNIIPLRKQRYWSVKEIRLLKHLVTNFHFSALNIVKKVLLKGRSVDSVAQMMRRLHLAANPERSRTMKNARRLSPAELNKLKAYLLGAGRKAPSRKVCHYWNINPAALCRHRRLLGASLSWSEARVGSKRSRRAT